MTPSEVREVAIMSAEAATEKTLQGLGVDIKSPLEMQRDFGHLRDWRITMQGIQRKLLLSFAAGAGATAMWLAWHGFQVVTKM